MKKRKSSKKRAPISKKQSAVAHKSYLIPILGLLVCIAIIISGIMFYTLHRPNLVSDYTITPEEQLLDTASKYNDRIEDSDLYFEKVQKETVNIDGVTDDHLIFYMTNGNRLALDTREHNLKLAEGGIEKFGKFEFTNFSEKELDIIETAKSHVIAYINSSSVLKEKAMLTEAVRAIPFYKYSDVEVDVDGLMNTSVATYIDNAIYINQKCEDKFCAYVATHELLHFICDLTNTTLFYPATTFEEAMTDALTRAIDPCYSTQKAPHYGYSILFDILYPYINVFKEDAIYAYFYGYEDLFEKMDSANFILEHDAFVSAMLGYLEDPDLADFLTSQIIEKWRRDFDTAN